MIYCFNFDCINLFLLYDGAPTQLASCKRLVSNDGIKQWIPSWYVPKKLNWMELLLVVVVKAMQALQKPFLFLDNLITEVFFFFFSLNNRFFPQFSLTTEIHQQIWTSKTTRWQCNFFFFFDSIMSHFHDLASLWNSWRDSHSICMLILWKRRLYIKIPC
jgi:hypothetical protein